MRPQHTRSSPALPLVPVGVTDVPLLLLLPLRRAIAGQAEKGCDAGVGAAVAHQRQV